MTTIDIIAEEARNLDTTCYRGSVKLAEPAMISQADIFDQVDNPPPAARQCVPAYFDV